jgi:hypothetical protein
MILPCKTGQPEWVMRNALVLTALANFRVVGKPYLSGLGKSCSSSGRNGWGKHYYLVLPGMLAEIIGEQRAMCNVVFRPRYLLELCVLRFCFLQDRDVAIRILPQRKEILICSSSLCCVSGRYVCPAKAQLG